jgi:hypothetical protein
MYSAWRAIREGNCCEPIPACLDNLVRERKTKKKKRKKKISGIWEISNAQKEIVYPVCQNTHKGGIFGIVLVEELSGTKKRKEKKKKKIQK